MIRLWIWLISFDHLLIPFTAGEKPNDGYGRYRLDSDWSKAIERLEIDYDERGRFPNRMFSMAFSRRNSWDLAGHFEVPYYAILYTNITRIEPGPDPAAGDKVITFSNAVLPGSACGAILVNPKQLMTTCGCLYAWWRWENFNRLTQSERRDFFSKKQINRFTMHDPLRQIPPRVPRIFMTHSQVFFNPDFSHWIDNDMRRHTAKWLKCDYWYSGYKFSQTDMQFGLALTNFRPAIDDLDLSSYIPWPPVPLMNLTLFNRLKKVSQKAQAPKYPERGLRARIVGMGFIGEGAFHDDLGQFITVHESLVDVEVEVVEIDECKQIFEDLKTINAFVEKYMICLKGLVRGEDGTYTVKDGLPGNSVLTGFGSLAGMVMDAKSLNKTEHYYLMQNFAGAIQFNIENDNNEYLLNRQKVIRAPLYREGGWEDVFLHYTDAVPAIQNDAAADEGEVPSFAKAESSSPPNFLLNFQTFLLPSIVILSNCYEALGTIVPILWLWQKIASI